MLKFVRNFSTHFSNKVVNVTLTETTNKNLQSLRLNFSDPNKTLQIPLVWLRDHCRSPQNYHHKSNQRVLNGSNFFELAKLSSYKFDEKNQSLNLIWENDHESNFRVEDILNWAVIKNPKSIAQRRVLWDNSNLKEIPTFSSKTLNLSEFIENFLKYGVVLVNDVEPTESATRELALKIGPIQSSFWGDIFVVTADEDESKKRDENLVANKDTSYTNIGLGLHTDGTHFNNTPGIQFLHCIKPARIGGENMLVDSFCAAEKLKRTHPDYFEILTQLPVEHRYVEGYDITDKVIESALFKVHNRAIHPVIKLHNGDLVQVRWEPYERAPYRFTNFDNNLEKDVHDAIKFYEAYEAFSKIIHDPENNFQLALQPGTVLFCDNFRVLHARTAFEGSRKVCGGYISRDDFVATVRPLIEEEIDF